MELLENNALTLFSILIALIILLSILSLYLSKKVKKQATVLEEKEEKITFLRKVNASNEHRFSTKEHDLEKEVLSLKHTVDTLEHEVRDGTKNQVVLKLESLQHKREQMLQRANLPKD